MVEQPTGCPVKQGKGGTETGQAAAAPVTTGKGWLSFFSSTNSSNTARDNTRTPASSSSSSGCPVRGSSSSTPASLEEAARHAQTPHPDQKIPLSTYRATSTIPKPNDNQHNNETATTASTTISPAHQPSNASKWVYPSEQQFYNAMKRKGWDLPPGSEITIPQVVQIHNAVNERGWSEVLKWERNRDVPNDNPRLVRFMGRPKDLSPRARFYSMLWLRNEPFDRHDWIVDRGDGTGERRYVIDFYNGKAEDSKNGSSAGSNSNGLPNMYLDVRPALDDVDSAQDRVKMFFRDAFPGIAAFMNTDTSSTSSTSTTTHTTGTTTGTTCGVKGSKK